MRWFDLRTSPSLLSRWWAQPVLHTIRRARLLSWALQGASADDGALWECGVYAYGGSAAVSGVTRLAGSRTQHATRWSLSALSAGGQFPVWGAKFGRGDPPGGPQHISSASGRSRRPVELGPESLKPPRPRWSTGSRSVAMSARLATFGPVCRLTVLLGKVTARTPAHHHTAAAAVRR